MLISEPECVHCLQAESYIPKEYLNFDMAFSSLEGVQHLFIIHLYGITQCMEKHLDREYR